MGYAINGTCELNGEIVRYQSEIANLPDKCLEIPDIAAIVCDFVSMWGEHGTDTGTVQANILVCLDDGTSYIEHYQILGRIISDGVDDKDVVVYLLFMRIEDGSQADDVKAITHKVLDVLETGTYTTINPELN